MSSDLTGIYNSDLEHEHLLDSSAAGWDKLGLIYELEPAGEIPEAVTLVNTLVVCQGEFQASFKTNGQWHHEQYTKGDVALFAAGELFSRVKIDRDVPLIDLFLPANILIDSIGKTATKISSFFAFDVFVSSMVFWVFVFREGRRLQMKFIWIYVLFNLTIDISFALPLFLWRRSQNIPEQLSPSSSVSQVKIT